jgi:hypothetical protein
MSQELPKVVGTGRAYWGGVAAPNMRTHRVER